MSDSKNDALSELLSSFALGPAWARATGDGKRPSAETRPTERPPRRRERDEREGPPRFRDGERRPFQKRGDKRDQRHQGPPPPREAPPAEGVRVSLLPDAQAVHLIGKEVHQVARVYPLFDVAKILLAERGRCRAIFESPEPRPPLLRGKLDESVFLTREDAQRHLWHSELRANFLDEETIEVDPPNGNFQIVARCGLSGEWLGPPNFHTYQTNLRRIHRERYPNMPFAAYTAKVRTERGEEAVNAWLDSMKKKTRWRIKGEGDDAWFDDSNDARRALFARCFDQAFEETRRAEVLASIPASHLSASLMTSLKLCGNHARNHPAILIPAVCKALESEHLPVFKRQGKLFTGPARPHPLPPGQALAERPAIIVEWIRNHKPAKLEGLWQAVLPEGGTAPPAEFAADLFWLLHQGHILLFTDDTLAVQELREPQANESKASPQTGKKRPPKNRKTEAETPAGQNPPAVSPIAETPATEAPKPETPAPETPAPEAPHCEQPAMEAPHPEAPPMEAPQPEAPQCEAPRPEAPPIEAPAAQLPQCEPPAPEIPHPEVPPCEPPAPEAPVFIDPVTEPPRATDEFPKNPTAGVDESAAL